MQSIKELEPSAVWEYFYEITQIPRASKKEDKILDYLIRFAKTHSLEWKQDKIGNIVIKKKATNDSSGTVILQSHVDMVCEKNSDVVFNFDTDPIQTYIDNGWVKAKGTTLGADCGIGVAVQLAILAAKNLEHPALECLFTVDEETGLTGAFGLGDDMLTGNYLINLDSEDEGEIFIGCAGGIDTVAEFEYSEIPLPDDMKTLKLEIKGLQGGHSGDDINRGLANSNILLARFLHSVMDKYGVLLSDIDGGNLRNAIPREAMACVAVPASHEDELKKAFLDYFQVVKAEYHVTEPDMQFNIEQSGNRQSAIAPDIARNLINAVFVCPNGVIAMSQDIENFVETSTNLASVKIKDGRIVISTSQRSSIESKKQYVSQMVATVFRTYGANVVFSEGYPGWAPVISSPLLAVFEDIYYRLFNKQAKVKAIHAGLECGLFLKKYPQLEMISIGPTIKKVHSPGEMLNIETVDKFWRLLVESLSLL